MGRVFAVSDLHGQRALWEQIKAYLQPDDRLYFLGDAIDRGPDGYAIMKELLLDGRATYLMGNHEFMMMEALQEIRHYGGEWVGEKLDLWMYNGCYPTLNAWAENGAMYDWIYVIDKEMPEYVEYVNKQGQIVALSHAGFTPGRRSAWRYDAVWDRKHLLNLVPSDFQDGHLIVVHGHTPGILLVEKLNACKYNATNGRTFDFKNNNGAIFYGEGFVKVDIDCGCFATGHTVLLDLDTWETIPFNTEIEE